MPHLFLVLFLAGFVMTQVVDYVGIYYLETAGFMVMGVSAVLYFLALVIRGLRKRSAAGESDGPQQ